MNKPEPGKPLSCSAMRCSNFVDVPQWLTGSTSAARWIMERGWDQRSMPWTPPGGRKPKMIRYWFCWRCCQLIDAKRDD